MNDFRVWIPWVNRPDLLRGAVNCLEDVWPYLTILDNSPSGLEGDWPCAVERPTYPLTFTQSQNYFFLDTKRQHASTMIWMHSDAECEVGSCTKLSEIARGFSSSGDKWGVIFTHYDCLSAVNVDAALDVGLYDTTFAAYFSDNDFYHRLDTGGWSRNESGIPVKHHGSQTINSDPNLKFMNGVTFDWYRQYYRNKWGGDPGRERYKYPFNYPTAARLR